MPVLENRKVVPDVARLWQQEPTQHGERVGAYRLNRWGPACRFYVGRHTPFLDDTRGAEVFLRAPEPFYCAMSRNPFDEFAPRGVPLKVVHERVSSS